MFGAQSGKPQHALFPFVHTDHPVVTGIVIRALKISIMATIVDQSANIAALVMTDLKQQHTVGFKVAMGRTDDILKTLKAVTASVKRSHRLIAVDFGLKPANHPTVNIGWIGYDHIKCRLFPVQGCQPICIEIVDPLIAVMPSGISACHPDRRDASIGRKISMPGLLYCQGDDNRSGTRSYVQDTPGLSRCVPG